MTTPHEPFVTDSKGVTRLHRRPEHICHARQPNDLTAPDWYAYTGSWWPTKFNEAVSEYEGYGRKVVIGGQTIGDTVLDMWLTATVGQFKWAVIAGFTPAGVASREALVNVQYVRGPVVTISASHVGGCGCDFIHYLKVNARIIGALRDSNRKTLLEQMRTGAWLPSQQAEAETP